MENQKMGWLMLQQRCVIIDSVCLCLCVCVCVGGKSDEVKLPAARQPPSLYRLPFLFFLYSLPKFKSFIIYCYFYFFLLLHFLHASYFVSGVFFLLLESLAPRPVTHLLRRGKEKWGLLTARQLATEVSFIILFYFFHKHPSFFTFCNMQVWAHIYVFPLCSVACVITSL
ncbi:T. brucei spp.-specific protein [Trypanosoma brucei gambiense DAL972]|uniref:T. brucei spp.-specific protein n=1 Tax=Trypanosoma brucei gambiense (strain MHOM/CI/86/DAL972) TaxID=679716 RepID=D0A7M1_TRYB9|nr:T. brucei spp.-specific protein [Trypanosoma brucei gambiense DAL972]CBH17672.1 T. brucei spp.-specific protein [Trypanosoma brucei gambiense DAL972]|eukprot:XP_011779936.1 T. brucei spp.-specific protein [Trypanosoma brucei gambiense DAL972]